MINDKLSQLLTEDVLNETKNTDVIDMFLSDSFPKNKKSSWGTENLKIVKEDNGWSVVNYSTPILYRPNEVDVVYLNKRKYSVTTSKIQNQMRYLASKHNIKLKEVDETEIKEKIDTAPEEPLFKNKVVKEAEANPYLTYTPMSKEEFLQKIKEGMKTGKWAFINAEVNGHKIQLKFAADNDVHVQIFKKDGVHVFMPRDYASKKETMKMFEDAIAQF